MRHAPVFQLMSSCPRTPPVPNIVEVRATGGNLRLIDELIDEAGRQAHEFADAEQAFNLATLREPYRIEGKKTIGYELAEQLGWRLPDVVVCPTGGGTGLIGMWKAFAEMETLGWIELAGGRAWSASRLRAVHQLSRHFALAPKRAFPGVMRKPTQLGLPRAICPGRFPGSEGRLRQPRLGDRSQGRRNGRCAVPTRRHGRDFRRLGSCRHRRRRHQTRASQVGLPAMKKCFC